MQSPASSLSGGERNRLLLAKLFAKPSNLLILDEPTNDLDVETLEVLEALILDYQGTVLIVSHDRSFINNVATSTIVFEEDAKLCEYVGGYDDWLRQKQVSYGKQPSEKASKITSEKAKTKKQKLSFAEKKQLAELPNEIERLEADIEKLQQQMAEPAFYQQAKESVQQMQQTLESLKLQLEQKYKLWEVLSQLESEYPSCGNEY
jgi:ATP-binding cassette subfamily F protein uup